MPETNNILLSLGIAKIIIIIKGKKLWRNKSENKLLNQERKIQEVEELIKLKIAKGQNKIKTWASTYLIE